MKKVESLYQRKNIDNEHHIELPKLNKIKSYDYEIKSSRRYDFRTSKSKLNMSRLSDFRSESYLSKE